MVLAENLAPKGLKKKVVSKCLGHHQSFRVFKRMQLYMLSMSCLDSALKSQMLYKCQFVIYLFQSKHLQRTQNHTVLLPHQTFPIALPAPKCSRLRQRTACAPGVNHTQKRKTQPVISCYQERKIKQKQSSASSRGQRLIKFPFERDCYEMKPV